MGDFPLPASFPKLIGAGQSLLCPFWAGSQEPVRSRYLCTLPRSMGRQACRLGPLSQPFWPLPPRTHAYGSLDTGQWQPH